MKTIPELKEVVLKWEDRRLAPPYDRGTVRTDLKIIEQMHFEAKCFGFTIPIDEPPERGGRNEAPDPLVYFVTGAASCFLNNLERAILIKNVNIDDAEITARAHWDRAKTREFTDMIYDIRLTGQESKEKAIEALHDAENRCFTHRTLSKAIPMTSNLYLNGNLITTHTVGPDNH